ncbi:hypothetical protein FRC14_008185 [Serendipita sp. 396]|nr:hypothetical protein FRC14_008185 [Serendipita sp. 396]KAG8791904.1 hypothetical protein FRC16_000231 [Serendipita sp. 398]KAG8857491.1 hypothetical protein FRC20_000271 [Serendipita sp. 405]
MFVVFKRLAVVALVFLCVSASTFVTAKGGRGGGGSHGGSGSSTDCATHKNQCVKLGKTWMSVGSFVEIIILGVCVIAAIVVVVLTKLGIIKVPQKPGPGTAQAQPDAAAAAAEDAETLKDLENQALIPLTPLSPPPTSTATASATASTKEMEPLVSSTSDQPYGLPPQQTKGLGNNNKATFQTLDSPPPPYHAPSQTTGAS